MPRGKKKLLVFLDGTNNQWDSRTNVRRLFEMISGEEDPQRLCFYVEGVGADRHVLLGNGFGWRMEARIRKAYAFLSEYYQPDDEIYIFGFSRGAHQARALAGLISHCGLIDTNHLGRRSLEAMAGEMIDWAKKTCEGASEADWNWAVNHTTPLYPTKLQCDEKLAESFPCRNRYAEIGFLGVWDTVPGSSFKNFGPSEEMEDWRPGIRYKLGSYPPIRVIAHALALDERRKKFRPVMLATPVDPTRTTLHQEWFTGSHSDVGGGYDNSSELSGITLDWMLGLLKTDGLFSAGNPTLRTNYAGLAHDSWTASCFWQFWPSESRWRPHDAKIHESVTNRLNAGLVWLQETAQKAYPTNYTIKDPGARPVEWRAGTNSTVSAAIRKPPRATVGEAPNEFIIEPWQPWNLTGYQLKAGKTYRFTAVTNGTDGHPYSDASHLCDANGPTGCGGWWFDFRLRHPSWLSPIRWFGPGAVRKLRVLKDQTETRASFLTVIGAIGMDDSKSNVFVIGHERLFKAHKDGELVVFCNDWPGGCGKSGDARFANSPTYANNTGLIRLKVELQ